MACGTDACAPLAAPGCSQAAHVSAHLIATLLASLLPTCWRVFPLSCAVRGGSGMGTLT